MTIPCYDKWSLWLDSNWLRPTGVKVTPKLGWEWKDPVSCQQCHGGLLQASQSSVHTTSFSLLRGYVCLCCLGVEIFLYNHAKHTLKPHSSILRQFKFSNWRRHSPSLRWIAPPLLRQSKLSLLIGGHLEMCRDWAGACRALASPGSVFLLSFFLLFPPPLFCIFSALPILLSSIWYTVSPR